LSLSGLHLIRRQQRALARWVLACFCLVWIQAALLPCAMAVVPGGMSGAAEEHCSYCPPESTAVQFLHGTAPDCTYPDEPQADSRPGAASALVVALPVVSYALETPAGTGLLRPDRARPPDRTGPPLAVTYCRFLK
jgi:hypothetical protein